MKNTLIKWLGGYTALEMAVKDGAIKRLEETLTDFKIRLAQAEKNDKRDSKGRFTKNK